MVEPHLPLPAPEPLSPEDTVQWGRDEDYFDSEETWRCPVGHRLMEWWPSSRLDGIEGYCLCGRVVGIWGTRDQVLAREEA